MSFKIEWNFYVNSTSKNTKNNVVLSFDDGPHPSHTPEILHILKKNNVPALFFVIGKHAQKYPEIIRQIVNEGHQIGIHTYSHPWNFGFLSTSSVLNEITQCSTIINEITGTTPTLFRPPFGITNPRIAKAVKKLNVNTIGWNLRTFDTQLKSPTPLIKKIKANLKSNSIILLHDRLEVTQNALPDIINTIQEQGFDLGSLQTK